MAESPIETNQASVLPTPEPVEPKTPKAEEPSRSQLDQIAELLGGRETSEPTEADDAREVEGSPKAKKAKGEIKTLHDAAERLGVKVEDLYALQVGLPGDETKYTLGELKDAFAGRDDFTVQQLEWEEQRAKQEGDLLRSRNELTELLSLLPETALKPEVLSKIREKHGATLARERQLTLEVIPAWQDESVREADLAGIQDHLSRAGFPSGYLRNVSDHRTMRYIRENYLREKRINDALARVKKKEPTKAQKPSGNRRDAATTDSKPPGKRIDPAVQQISQLLRG